MKNESEQRKHTTAAAAGAVWISYSEAQTHVGLGRTKLWELISTGEVDAAKVGHAVRINRQSLNEYMMRNRYAVVDR